MYRLPPEDNHNFGRINHRHLISHLIVYGSDPSFKKLREEWQRVFQFSRSFLQHLLNRTVVLLR